MCVRGIYNKYFKLDFLYALVPLRALLLLAVFYILKENGYFARI